MDWSKGFSSSYYMTLVDPVTWADTRRIEIIDGSISHQEDGLMESADFTCSDFEPDREQWVRVYLNTAQNGESDHIALFTGLSSVPEINIDGTKIRYPLTCYSVLKPAEDILLQRGWFASQGINGAEIIRELLSPIPAPISIPDYSPKLTQYIIAEDGESHLSMANKVLSAMNWRMRINGDGSIDIAPKPTNASAIFGLENDVIELSVSKKVDWFKCPNVIRVTSGDRTYTFKDEDSDSILSIANRGREVWYDESSADISDSESIEMYAQRRLQELQSVVYSVRYSRRYNPNVYVGDLVEMRYPNQNLIDTFRVTSQSIQLGHSVRVNEEVQK